MPQTKRVTRSRSTKTTDKNAGSDARKGFARLAEIRSSIHLNPGLGTAQLAFCLGHNRFQIGNTAIGKND